MKLLSGTVATQHLLHRGLCAVWKFETLAVGISKRTALSTAFCATTLCTSVPTGVSLPTINSSGSRVLCFQVTSELGEQGTYENVKRSRVSVHVM